MSEQPREVTPDNEDDVDNVNSVVINDVNIVNIDPPDMAELRKYLAEVANDEGLDSGEV